MPLHISLVLSLVLHLALYTVADWMGLHAPPPPPPRQSIEAMLILPEIRAPAPELPPAAAEPDADAAPASIEMPVPATLPPPAAAPAPLPAPPPAPAGPAPLALYPHEAVLRGLEGDVDVAVTLDAAGSVVAARIGRSSGHAILDEAALRAVRTLRSLPGGSREATLPVRFRLR